MKVLIYAVMLFGALLGCVHQNPKPARKLATTEAPPKVISKQTWLYSWTNNPKASEKPKDYLIAELQRASRCLTKIQLSKEIVSDCEGNGFAAGPGLYASDNPFTSHDYGSTVLIIQSNPNLSNIINHLPESHGEAASMERNVYGDLTASSIIYDFRPTPLNTKAIVFRRPSILNLNEVSAIVIPANEYRKFAVHSKFVCTDTTRPHDILSRWGDQIDFMSIIFLEFNNRTEIPFIKNGKLSQMAYAAAVASDAVALPEANLVAVSAQLISKYNLDESLSSGACAETRTLSLRSCLAMRIFDSLQEHIGTDRWPRYSWDLGTTKNVLVDLGGMKPMDANKITEASKLREFLAQSIQKNAIQNQRIKEAFHCMEVIRNGLSKTHLETWIQRQEVQAP